MTFLLGIHYENKRILDCQIIRGGNELPEQILEDLKTVCLNFSEKESCVMVGIYVYYDKITYSWRYKHEYPELFKLLYSKGFSSWDAV